MFRFPFVFTVKNPLTLGLFGLFLAFVVVGNLPIVQAKRPPKMETIETIKPLDASTMPAVEPTEPIVTKNKKISKQPKVAKHKKQPTLEAQVASFELEPPANPDYPAQLCGKRRERLVQLQTMPWVVKPFFLGERRIEQWQYRLCLSRTMPEVQRYLETFPVPYTPNQPE
jgi:hypothetical protein